MNANLRIKHLSSCPCVAIQAEQRLKDSENTHYRAKCVSCGASTPISMEEVKEFMPDTLYYEVKPADAV